MQSHASGATQAHGEAAPYSDSDLPRYVRRRPFALVLLITGAVSWIAAWLLVLERIALFKDPEHVTACDVNPWISCGAVMETPQAALFGFPNPFIGLAAFAVVITTAMAMLAGARLSRWYWLGLQAGVTLGMAFIVWLWFQALYVIHILCPYCMVVWAMMIFLFVLLTARNILHGVLPAPRGLQKFAADSAWPIAVLICVACAASIFFRFIGVFTAG